MDGADGRPGALRVAVLQEPVRPREVRLRAGHYVRHCEKRHTINHQPVALAAMGSGSFSWPTRLAERNCW
jgi:hypothetical protein